MLHELKKTERKRKTSQERTPDITKRDRSDLHHSLANHSSTWGSFRIPKWPRTTERYGSEPGSSWAFGYKARSEQTRGTVSP